MDGTCDVKGCTEPTFVGWRPLTERLGRQVCEYHWRRHQDPDDDFDLFEAFGFRRPAGLRKPPAKDVPRCACGRERLPGRKFCTDCAEERERQRKKEAYHERKKPEPQPVPVEDEGPRCGDCAEPREAGHRYCSKCAQKREKQSNRERRRRSYRKSLKRVGLM